VNRFSQLPLSPSRYGPLFDPNAGGGTPSDEKVTLTKEEHAALLAAAAAAKKSQEGPDLTRLVQRAFDSNATEDQRLEASAMLLKEAGYSDDQIVEMLAGDEPEAPAPQPTPRTNTRSNQRGGGDVNEQLLREIQELKAQVSQQGKMTTEQRYKRLTDIHTRSIEQELTAGELKKVIETVTQGLSEKEKGEVLETLKKDVVQSSRDILRQRRDKAGDQLDEAWIPEAVKQAAQDAAKKARLFGGGSRVGPSTELELADESFLKQPEKKLEDPRKVDDPERTLDEYNADALGRVVAEARVQGKSAV
jgi:hypothetical protein